MQHRTTKPDITAIQENEVFVFGSNLSGRHGKGAAKTAMKWGARYGNPAGLQGRTYAIPTTDKTVLAPLPIGQVEAYVNEFILFAQANAHLTFLVTEIGCGLAGFTPDEIAPLFALAKDYPNIHLPQRFWNIIEQATNFKQSKT